LPTRPSHRALFLVLLVCCAFAQCTLACAFTTCDTADAKVPPCHRQKQHQPHSGQTCERLALVAESPAPAVSDRPQASQSQPVYLPATVFADLRHKPGQLFRETALNSPLPPPDAALHSVLRI
jgi:hypothetical protein